MCSRRRSENRNLEVGGRQLESGQGHKHRELHVSLREGVFLQVQKLPALEGLHRRRVGKHAVVQTLEGKSLHAKKRTHFSLVAGGVLDPPIVRGRPGMLAHGLHNTDVSNR